MTRRRARTHPALALLAACTITACLPATRTSVRAPDVPVPRTAAWAWADESAPPDPETLPRTVGDLLLDTALRRAITDSLAARGWRAAPLATADHLVTFEVDLRAERVLDAVFPAAVLGLEVWRVRPSALAWRGEVTLAFTREELDEAWVGRLVGQALAQLPAPAR
ncbi:MAG: DUF4136 domain-containing protein [Gemmatimonadales bacterium]|nr:DUF4136 domain-containing protein [Gemmatimonadales bacterium]